MTLLEGTRFAGHEDSEHEVYMDASPKVGGNDSVPRPLELMLFALGGFTGMDVIIHVAYADPEILGSTLPS